MKAEELMIGDWVHIGEFDKYSGTNGKIVSLQFHQKDDGAYFNIFISGDKGCCTTEVFNEDIEPILLTPEILEKNGIKYQYGSPWYQGGDEDGIEIHFALYCQMKLHYVHQLQHALRLCEIDKEIKL